MTVSIHQPNFIPWLGYFYKIAKSDVFVLLDDVQYTKNGFTNRNRIKTPQGELWLSLPIKQSGNFGQTINDCIIQQKEIAVKKNLNSIKLNYGKAKYFHQYFEQLCSLMNTDTESLAELNILLIQWVCECLDINTKIVRSSLLNLSGNESTERLIEICSKLNGKIYLSGKGGFNYQDETLFEREKITLERSSFAPPVYHQLWGDFIGGLSIMDTLLNCGPDTKKLIHQI